MKASSRRPEQVAETVRQVVTEALAREVRDPRVGFVTVTGVLVTNDLSHARVMVSVPGDEAEQARALEGLEERRRLPPVAGGAGADDPRSSPSCTSSWTAAWSTRPGSTSCSRGSGGRRPELIGALLVDKPAGPTSHDVVPRVRRVLRTRAVGHTGTLDPFATGLLVVLVGRATRLARFVEAERQDLPRHRSAGRRDRYRRPHGRAARVGPLISAS